MCVFTWKENSKLIGGFPLGQGDAGVSRNSRVKERQGLAGLENGHARQTREMRI